MFPDIAKGRWIEIAIHCPNDLKVDERRFIESLDMKSKDGVDIGEGAEATIGDAVRLMNERSFRNIPLVVEGQLRGSISVFDIITYLAECYPKSTMNLPPLRQVMDTVDGG